MKNFKPGIVLLLTLLIYNYIYSQDIITLINGDEIEVKITEIYPDEVKYKNYDNIDGPTRVLLKKEVFAIKYENGIREVFTTAQTTDNNTNIYNDKDCTIIFYRKNKSLPLVLLTLRVELSRLNPNTYITGLDNATYYRYTTPEQGIYEFVAGVRKNSKPLKIKLEAGKTYYVSCWAKDHITLNFGAGMELVDEDTALEEIKGLREIRN